MKITRIGIDLAKQVFQLHGVDVNERVVLRRQLKRKEMVDFFKALRPATSAWRPAPALTTGHARWR